jgi:acetolactate synthase I/II/III large subunit
VILTDYLHQQLSAAGVTRAFGVPGYFVMPVWHAFRKDPQIILARHEGGAAFMADGYARATGNLGVVLTTSGPGVTNTATGVASAYQDSVPMLVISGQGSPTTFGRGVFQESFLLDRSASPAALLAPITKTALEIVAPENAAFMIDTAITLALSGRRGPVHLSIPLDQQQLDIPVPPPPRPDSPPTVGDVPAAPCILDAAELLRSACRPLILAGWGSMLARAQPEIARLSAQLGAVVVTSTKAVSCLPRDHPMLLGHFGPGQRSDIAQAVSSYQPDVVLVVGASLSRYYANPLAAVLENAATIRIDISAEQVAFRMRADVGIVGDAREAVSALRSVIAAGGADSGAEPDRSAVELVSAFQERAERAALRQKPESHGMPSVAGTIVRLSRMLPPDAVVIPDAGNHWLDTISLCRAGRTGGVQLNCGVGAMGWAIGASVGMAMVASQQGAAGRGPLTVCVTGDGSMLMHGAELTVAAEHELNLLVVVFNNRSHGRVRLGQRLDFDREPMGTDIPGIDFAQWMSAMGLRTFRIDHADQVDEVLAAALATPGTVGVEVLCHPDEVPACLRSWIED